METQTSMNDDICNYVIDSHLSLADAIKKMTDNPVKGLVIIENQKVVGVFTRKDLTKCTHVFGIKNISIKPFMNRNFTFCFSKIDKEYVNSSYSLIPILDSNYTLLDVFFPKRKKITTFFQHPVVIMAGGLGTRLYPYTKILPKPLVPVINEKPMIELVMDTFYKYNNREYYLIVNHKKEMIESYFNENPHPYKVMFGEEDEQLGTGGGLCLIKDQIDETFFLTNCDILCLEDYNEIYTYHKDSHNIVTMIVSLKSVKIPYGVIKTNENQEIVETIEKPTYMIMVNTGIYVVDPIIFSFIGHKERIDFPEVLERLNKANEKVGVYPITEDKWIDMGQIDEFEIAKKNLKERWQ